MPFGLVPRYMELWNLNHFANLIYVMPFLDCSTISVQLWNELYQKTQGEEGRIITDNAELILTEVRHVYVALHRGTDGAPAALTLPNRRSEMRQHLSTYPLCNIPGHHSDSSSHAHESSVAEASQRPATASVDVPHRDSVLANITPFSSPAYHPDDSTLHHHPDWSSTLLPTSLNFR